MKLNYNYIKDNEFAPAVLVVGDKQIINPTAEMYAEAGYMPYTPPTPTAEEIAQVERDARMKELQELIAKTDWKITKTCEYQLLGLPAPYDVAQLHAERQALRDEYNQLESDV